MAIIKTWIYFFGVYSFFFFSCNIYSQSNLTSNYSHLYNSYLHEENSIIVSPFKSSSYTLTKNYEFTSDFSFNLIDKWYNLSIKHKMFEFKNSQLISFISSWMKGKIKSYESEDVSFQVSHNSLLYSKKYNSLTFNYGKNFTYINYKSPSLSGDFYIFSFIIGSDFYLIENLTLSVATSFPVFSFHEIKKEETFLSIHTKYFLMKDVTEFFIPYSYFINLRYAWKNFAISFGIFQVSNLFETNPTIDITWKVL